MGPSQGTGRLRRRAVAVAVVMMASGLVAGCATRPFADGFYVPPHLAPLREPRQPVAVYLFADARGVEDPRVLGQFESGWVSRATEPVAAGVTRGIMDGLRRRGFPVVDRTSERLGSDESSRALGVAITGDVRQFYIAGYERGGCEIVVRVHSAGGGRPVAERTYAAHEVDPGGHAWNALGRALARVIEDAMSDPILILKLSEP